MASVPIYNAIDVTLTVGGRVIKGFQDGDMITYSTKENRVQTEVDAQGVASIAVNNGRLGQIVVNLSGNSTNQKYLNDLANKNSQFPVVLKSKSEKISGNQAFIAKPADGAYGKATPKRTYTIEVLDMQVDVL